MIDIECAKKEITKQELQVKQWLDEHGYKGRIEKQLLGKTVFSVEKDGIKDVLELSTRLLKTSDINKFLSQFEKNWDTLREVKTLRAKAKEEGLQ